MSLSFYEKNAQQFFDSTKDVDMSQLYAEFLPLLTSESHILDAGCGSGRDSLAFIQRGFLVTSFDGCRQLATLAGRLTQQQVQCCKFIDFESDVLFDAIWASASLLHVKFCELPEVFSHLTSYLKFGGVFYCSFKLGGYEGVRNGRHFTNLDETHLKEVIINTSLHIKKTWISSDVRPNRENEKWLNALLWKGRN